MSAVIPNHGDRTPAASRATGTRQALPFLMLAGGAVVYAALFFYVVSASVVWAPVYDYLDWVSAYLDAAHTGRWWSYAWMPHNEHRIVLSRLLVSADVRLFDASHTAFIATGVVLTLSLVAAMLRMIAAGSPDTQTAVVGTAAMIFILMPSSIATLCSMPANQVFLHQAAFAVFAIIWAVRPGKIAHIFAMAAALLAALGGAGGILVWPVLALMALELHRSWRLFASYVIFGVMLALGYFSGAPPVGHPYELSDAVAIADYFIRFFGLPWSHLSALEWPARAIGASLVSIGCIVLVSGRRTPIFARRVGRYLIVFAFCLGAAAAVARFSVAADRAMPIRYALFPALLQAGICLVLLPKRNGAIRRLRGPGVEIAVALFLALVLAQQIFVGRAAIAETARYNAAWARFAGGEWDAEMIHYVYPDRDRAARMLAAIRAADLYRPR